MSKHRCQRGYTLLEVVVAFAILAVSLAALYASWSMTLRHAAKARNLQRAALLADSVRDQLGLTVNAAGDHGSDADCRWVVHGGAAQRPKDSDAAVPAIRPVALDVECGAAGALAAAHLDTVALEAAP